jgi:hypothetical protein
MSKNRNVFVAAASDTPASSTSKTGRHDIAEILLKVVSNTKNQSIKISLFFVQNLNVVL